MGISATYERHLSLVNANRAIAEARARDLLSREQLTQSERARSLLQSELGRNAPRTYEEYQERINAPRTQTSLTYPRWIEIYQGDEFHGGTGAAGGNLVHPGKALEFYKESPTFQYLSAKQAQLAEGSLFGRGELFENYQESVMNPVIEGAAASWREAQQLIARQAARGGSSRRLALAAAEKMRVAEQINRDKTQNLWQANLALRQYMDQAANAQIAFNQAWVNNLGFIRDAYNQAFQSLSEYYGSTILPQTLALSEFQFQSAVTLDAIERQQKALRKQKQMQLIQLGAGIATAVAGGFLLSSAAAAGAATTSAKGIIGQTLLKAGAATATGALGGGGFTPPSIEIQAPSTPQTPGVSTQATRATQRSTNIRQPYGNVFGILPGGGLITGT